jgi:hypothetical protein
VIGVDVIETVSLEIVIDDLFDVFSFYKYIAI